MTGSGDRQKLIERLQSIAIQAVQAQGETDIEKLSDLLADIERDVAFAQAAVDKIAREAE